MRHQAHSLSNKAEGGGGMHAFDALRSSENRELPQNASEHSTNPTPIVVKRQDMHMIISHRVPGY